jgi:hypothetical protein
MQYLAFAWDEGHAKRYFVFIFIFYFSVIVVANIQHSASEGFSLPPPQAFLRGFPKVLNLLPAPVLRALILP